nr:MAG: capsid protein [Longquan rodent picorna-like virus 1]
METSKNQEQPEQRESVVNTDNEFHSELTIHDIEEITKFTDEVPPQIAPAPDQPNVPEESDPFPDQQLINFLSRPRPVYSFKWQANTPVGTCLARLSFPDLLFYTPTIWNKIQQFVYFHAGLRFEVRVNGTPFNYGQLMFVWRPATVYRTLNTNPTGPGIYDSMYTVSQYPHMLVAPYNAQSVVMTVPYESPLERIPLSAYGSGSSALRHLSSLGLLEIWNLVPLRGQGPANSEPAVSVTLFASFTNPNLSGYTHKNLAYENVLPPAIFTYALPTGMRYVSQVAQAGEDQQPAGPSLGSSSLPTTMEGIPAQLPIVFEPAKTSMARFKQSSYPLALTEDTHLFPGKGTSLRDHFSIWSLLDQFTISTSSNTNALLASYVVIPTNCPVGTHLSKTVYYNTKLSYVSNLFSLWRGPIEYRFDFIASKFHSCRVKIAWYPPSTTGVALNEESTDAWSQIVDIQSQTSVVFTVPYLQAFPYLLFNSYIDSSNGANGNVVVTLLNSVTYPLLNGPPVHVNVWIRAPQLQLAAYCGSQLPPCSFFAGIGPSADRTPLFPNVNPPVKVAPNSKFSQCKVSEVKNAKGKKPLQVAQANELPISPVEMEELVLKPTFQGVLTSGGKIWITPPLPEELPQATASAMVKRPLTLLGYLALMHIGFRGSVRLSFLEPSTEVLAIPRLCSGYGLTKTEKSNEIATLPYANRFSASAYFPNSANSLKDITLPNYSTLVYRPISLFRYDITDNSFSVPGVDIFSVSGPDTLFTLAAAPDFKFVGMAPAPMTLA